MGRRSPSRPSGTLFNRAKTQELQCPLTSVGDVPDALEIKDEAFGPKCTHLIELPGDGDIPCYSGRVPE